MTGQHYHEMILVTLLGPGYLLHNGDVSCLFRDRIIEVGTRVMEWSNRHRWKVPKKLLECA